ncbi:HAD family hydrolase [Streptomyces goshikiensis]|uniref:HAD family hydrolase n=1 Tax=Streptomyces goshikiensis TaxID=1942 RepID=UPI0036CB98CE
MHRLALFDLDGTLADRQSTLSDAVTGLCRVHTLSPAAEQWLRTELFDRANAAWSIGAITNGAGDIQRAKLAVTGLAHLVDGVAVLGNLESRKPDLRLFELAATRCGVSLAGGGWMTGDNPAGDIGGGHQAGLRTIWLRGRPCPDDLPAAHHVVDDDVTDAVTILLNETSE